MAKPVNREEKEHICALYGNHYSARSIARTYGRSAETIVRILRVCGVVVVKENRPHIQRQVLKDTGGKYLGALCKRGHDWNRTYRSLRYKGGVCVKCSIDYERARPSHTTKNMKSLQRNWYKKHKEAVKLKTKKYTKDNREAINVREKKLRDNLADNYIKATLRSTIGMKFSDIPPELIKLKRTHLRLIRALRKEQTDGRRTCKRTG